jgi:enamine deaminase RidA (YjgF/YER057c/UK114 family)
MAHGKVVIPDGMQVQYEEWHIAPGLLVGDTLYCSGQIGIGPDGTVSSDPDAQFRQAFEHVGKILEAAGGGFEDIVELSSFHVGLIDHMEIFTKVRAEFIKRPFPAETAVGVAELGIPGALVEIRATAILRSAEN